MAMDYDPRTCIVCRSTFKPRRWDQIYCGGKANRACEHKLLRWQNRSLDMLAKALDTQDGCCAWCGAIGREKAYSLHAPDARLAPGLSLMFLSPSKVPTGGYVASCKSCRAALYIRLACDGHSSIV